MLVYIVPLVLVVYPLGGVFVLLMSLMTIGGGLLALVRENQWLLVAGLMSWIAASLLFLDLVRGQRIQVGLLLAVGLLLLGLSTMSGAEINFQGVISGNTGLLTMITSVGFLRLVAIPDERPFSDDKPSSSTKSVLPIGPNAYVQTLLGTALFGAVINISAPMLIADRIHQYRPLKRFTSQSITRVFSGAASWSPFFAGTAVVLTVVPEAQLSLLMMAGFPFAVIGILIVYAEARWRYSEQMDDFVGYPLRLNSLLIPGMLAVLVLLSNWLLPNLSILIAIALSALLITTMMLIYRLGMKGGWRQLVKHVSHGLPRVVNELTLFLSAGVLATGISSMIQVGFITIPLADFDSVTAVVIVGAMVIAGAMGIHPVILISALTPLLLTLNPNPNLLALSYLFAWSMGTSASPLSGTHLVFQSRYGIPGWKGAVWNWPYVAVMLTFAAVWLLLMGSFFFDRSY
ncbi:MAG: hypothetical protein GKR96_00660 [Gammaproteobacteria bacterium]|nr:hypothetical protein [Gammaproteobacteria bacterium]